MTTLPNRSHDRQCLLAIGVMLLAWSAPLHAEAGLFSLPRLTPEEILPSRSDFLSQKTLLGDWGDYDPGSINMV